MTDYHEKIKEAMKIAIEDMGMKDFKKCSFFYTQWKEDMLKCHQENLYCFS